VSLLVFVEETPLRGRRHPAAHNTTIGRQGCDVLLVDPEVSRRHAIVLDTSVGPAIEDVGSTNGTWVNDRRIAAPHLLRAGDVVRFGNTVWRVIDAAQEDADETLQGVPSLMEG
jgi:pSer/pThr/pTyr-binding forkhead associated (FHA) protein